MSLMRRHQVSIKNLDPYTSNMPLWLRDAANKLNELILYNNGVKSVVNVNSNHTLGRNETFILFATAGNTLTLAGEKDIGRRVILKNHNHNGSNTISGQIDGNASTTLSGNYGSLQIISDGVQWWSY